MSIFNLVVIMGRLTRDLELRYSASGTAVANTSLAINSSFTPKGGERREETTFVECTLFGKTAENTAKFCKKGSPIHVSGRLKTESWTDKTTGKERQKLVVVAESVQFIGGKGDGESAPRAAAPTADAAKEEADSSVPF